MMSRYNGVYETARIRRFMRPDAHRRTRPDAANVLGPGVDPADVYSAPAQHRDALQLQRDRELGEAIAHERAVLDELRRELAEIKSHLVRRRVRRRVEAKYSPSQPRVPAGQTDGGRWSSQGNAGSQHSGINDPRVISDVDPDDRWLSGAEYAADATSGNYSVNLDEEEVRGGHTLSDHVGKTDDELMARVRSNRGQAGIYRYARERDGSFDSRFSANDFVNRTLESNRETVDNVASGQVNDAFLKTRFGNRTGREAYRPDIDSEPYLRDTYEVGVFILHDRRSERGYRVQTAYPRNERRR